MHQPFGTDWLIVRPIEEIELLMAFAAFLDHTDDPNSLPNAGSHNTFYFRALEPRSLQRARRRLRPRIGSPRAETALVRLPAAFACR